jgi:hypothetical protein
LLSPPHDACPRAITARVVAFAFALAGCDAAQSASQRHDADAPLEVLDAGSAPLPASMDAASALPLGDAGGPDAAYDADLRHVPLASAWSWVRVAAGADPFSDAPATVDCLHTATMAETLGTEDAFSVNTGACNYITVAQPSLGAVATGDTLLARVWHFELNAPENADAHVAVLVDGLMLLEERVPIPHAGGLLRRELTVERPIAAGAPIHFHLHNHGANSWAIVEVAKLVH